MQAAYSFFLEAFWAVSSWDASISALHCSFFVMQIMHEYAGGQVGGLVGESFGAREFRLFDFRGRGLAKHTAIPFPIEHMFINRVSGGRIRISGKPGGSLAYLDRLRGQVP